VRKCWSWAPPTLPGSHGEGDSNGRRDFRAPIRIAELRLKDPYELATWALTIPIQVPNSTGHAQHVADGEALVSPSLCGVVFTRGSGNDSADSTVYCKRAEITLTRTIFDSCQARYERQRLNEKAETFLDAVAEFEIAAPMGRGTHSYSDAAGHSAEDTERDDIGVRVIHGPADVDVAANRPKDWGNMG
jgi:hypothetical protein